jgi:hypothetical protein
MAAAPSSDVLDVAQPATANAPIKATIVATLEVRIEA